MMLKPFSSVSGEDIVFLATDINLPGAVDWVMMQTCFGHHFMLVLEKQEKSEGNQLFYTIVQLIGTRKQAENFAYRLIHYLYPSTFYISITNYITCFFNLFFSGLWFSYVVLLKLTFHQLWNDSTVHSFLWCSGFFNSVFFAMLECFHKETVGILQCTKGYRDVPAARSTWHDDADNKDDNSFADFCAKLRFTITSCLWSDFDESEIIIVLFD